MHVTIVGTGYVGLVTGTCFANMGNDVVCLDVDEAKIERLNQGQIPIYEPGLEELLRRNVAGRRLSFTTDKQEAYRSAEVIFLCVGTPSDEQGQADLRYVLQAAEDIGSALDADPDYPPADRMPTVVVIKSTVPVGTNKRVQEAIAAVTTKPFRMASNPEFLKEGAAIADFNRPDRVVIGTHDQETAALLTDLYQPFVRQGHPIFAMDVPSAEMVKYASNAMLATKISFINEIANLCEAYGADVDRVRQGMCADRRIGTQFLYPGLGYGGSCFPKDVLAVIAMGEATGTPVDLLAAVHDVNQRQRKCFLAKIDEHFTGGGAGGEPCPNPPMADLAGLTVAVWGIAFKPGTDDVREAPAVTLIEALLARGAQVVAYDPAAAEACERLFRGRVRCVAHEMEALDGASALVICTNWEHFMHPDFAEMKQRMATPVIFDGRNLYSPQAMAEHGFVYHSVGRAPVCGTAPRDAASV